MIGGQKTGVRRLGVTWGFGSLESLQEHGAESICHHPYDIKKHYHLYRMISAFSSIKLVSPS